MSVTGSLQKKSNSWYAVLSIPDEDGRKKAKWINLGRCSEVTKRNAEAELQRLKMEYGEGAVYSRNLLFADWVQEWYEHRAITAGLAQTTLDSYKNYIEKYIDPYFRGKKIVLQKTKAVDIQRFYDKLIQDGLSAQSVHRYHTVVKQSLDYAYKQGIINENPILRVEVPKAPRTQHGTAYTAEEVNALFEAAKGTRLFPVIYLTAWYGLRRSEILGLTWGNIDIEARTMDICQVVTRVNSLVIAPRTKNDSSHRRLWLTDETCQLLRQLRLQQSLERMKLGVDYVANDFVCKMGDGQMMKPEFVSISFKKLLEKNDLRPIRFHDLRHTAATLLLESGVQIQDVSRYLGHSNISVTMDTYGHLSAETNRRTADKMSQLLASS